MSKWCNSPFWDLNLTWYTENPDFTECFKKTALQWFPCLYLWIYLPLELHNFNTSKMRDIPFNKFNLTKMVAIFCLIGTSIAELINGLQNDTKELADIYSPAVKLLSFSLFLFLTRENMKMGIRSSGVSLVFSSLLLICGIPSMRDVLKVHHPSTEIVVLEENKLGDNIFVVYYSSVLLIFILNLFEDERPRYSFGEFDSKQCPSQNSSFLSRTFYNWFTKYVWKGSRIPVTDVLWYVNYEDSAAAILPEFEKYFKAAATRDGTRCESVDEGNEYDFDDIPLMKESICTSKRDRTDCSINFPILRLTWLRILESMVWKGMEIVLNIAPSLILSRLITFVDQKEPIWKAYSCVVLFFVNSIIVIGVQNRHFDAVLKIQIRVKTALLASIYKKSLRISNKRCGDVLNVMSVDLERIRQSIETANNLWARPVQIIFAFYIIWNLFGTSTMVSIIILVLVMTASFYLVRFSGKMRVKEMQCKDKRGKFLQDILSGIKVLKMYAWEAGFEKMAFALRQNELKHLKKLAVTNIVFILLFICPLVLFPFATILTYILRNENDVLDVKKVFMGISLFGTFQMPMFQIPVSVSDALQAYVSLRRINKFLNSEELDETAVAHDEREEALIIENGTFSWGNTRDSAVLKDINVKIKDGSLVAIVGPVGVGKSSLISSFLGETNKISGYVNVKGTVSYVPQQAWILSATLQDNITMKDAVNEALYNEVLEACVLKDDLLTMPEGDMTEIGEKGINLSGGQKQRVSLARALCSKKDIYFFDDPLSAVDHKVAEHIFHDVIGPNGMLRNKTRVLVTHNIWFLHKMDFIIVLKNGTVSESGTFDELMERSEEFSEFLKSCYEYDDRRAEVESLPLQQRSERHETHGPIRGKKAGGVESIPIKNNKGGEPVKDKKSKGLIKAELVKSGNIKLNVYLYYIKAAGIRFVASSVIFFIVFQSLSISSNIWLAAWTTASGSSETRQEHSKYYYLIVYTSITISQMIVSSMAVFLVYKSLMRASTILYRRLVVNVIRWPMWMFDCTPLGRIINRFTLDFDDIDNKLGKRANAALFFSTKAIAFFFVYAVHVPLCAIFAISGCIATFIIQKFHTVLSHQIQRIDSINRSPLYSHFVETTLGLESIRAYNIQGKFIKRMLNRNDVCSATAHSVFVCLRWLKTRIQLLASLVVTVMLFFVLFERERFHEGFLAFIITLTISVPNEINILVTSVTDIENTFVSVERIKEYIEFPQEEADSQSTSTIPPNWPDRGEVIFQNYNSKYHQESHLTLKNINFIIKSGEKIGIIGRTGAGKSSIISALFRMMEPAGGQIKIDSVDISTVELYALRSKLTVIPQDPILFVGNLRFNLDPFGYHTDEVLWEVLDKAHLKDFVRGLPNGLYCDVENGGENLSFGQKQLVCLARALLRRTKILVLDEATASVDLETDRLIQRTIRKEFSHCTIITIAHRINTLQDYDKILAIENGTVVEFDSPTNLLRDEGSMFYKTVSSSGILYDEKKD